MSEQSIQSINKGYIKNLQTKYYYKVQCYKLSIYTTKFRIKPNQIFKENQSSWFHKTRKYTARA